jgi:stage V sporulation protein SpoVS
VGATSLNQAIKSIAVARTFLEGEGKDLRVEVSRVPDETIRHLLQLKLSAVSKAEADAQVEAGDGAPVELRAAKTTETVALAGAIANNVRDGKRVHVMAIGPVPVFRAVDAITKARQFLQKDQIDIVFVPSFTTITTTNTTTTSAANGTEGDDEKRSGVMNAMQLTIFKMTA